ncbi:MAG TPA: MFS transporter [Candidatus Binatia bacterium]|nr:MFS transporter [Candidatus Binatia bacterium]
MRSPLTTPGTFGSVGGLPPDGSLAAVGDTAGVPTAVDRGRLAIFAVCHGVDDMYQGVVPALLPYFVLERHYSYAAATGLIFALNALSSAVQPVFGALTDRLDLYWLVPAGLSLAGIGVGLSGLSGNYALTFLAITATGVGVAAFHPEGARAARGASGDSQRAMSLFSVGGNIGYAFGPLLVLLALMALPGTSGTALLAVPALVTGTVVLSVLTRQHRVLAPHRGAARVVAGRDDVHSFLGLSAIVALRSIVSFGLSSLVALYVANQLGGGKALGEAALTVMVAFGAVGTVTGGWLADRFGRLRVMALSFAATFVTVVAVALAPLPWVLLPIAATGFSLYQSFSLTMTLGQDYLPTRIGTSSGVTLGLGITAGGLLAPGLGALADVTSLRTSLLALLVFLPIALVITMRLRDPRRPLSQKQAAASLPTVSGSVADPAR